MKREDVIESIIAPACDELGVELVDVECPSGVVRVTVDRPGGLDLDAVAAVSRAISEALDQSDDAPSSRYELEVSTPGLERRLRRPAHFVAAVGRDIAIRTTAGTPGDRRVEGRLASVDDQAITVVFGRSSERRIAFEEIERAHTVFDWRAALAVSRDASQLDELEIVSAELDDAELDDAELDDAELDDAELDDAETHDAETDVDGTELRDDVVEDARDDQVGHGSTATKRRATTS